MFGGAFNAFWPEPNMFERLRHLTLPQQMNRLEPLPGDEAYAGSRT